jgi:hypothetical protein
LTLRAWFVSDPAPVRFVPQQPRRSRAGLTKLVELRNEPFAAELKRLNRFDPQ